MKILGKKTDDIRVFCGNCLCMCDILVLRLAGFARSGGALVMLVVTLVRKHDFATVPAILSVGYLGNSNESVELYHAESSC